ncbi:MAG: hypothetical protein KC933_30725 [Myxococcales bacterium]|nr:hypothetical protein [Myxococcales bacterium]
MLRDLEVAWIEVDQTGSSVEVTIVWPTAIQPRLDESMMAVWWDSMLPAMPHSSGVDRGQPVLVETIYSGNFKRSTVLVESSKDLVAEVSKHRVISTDVLQMALLRLGEQVLELTYTRPANSSPDLVVQAGVVLDALPLRAFGRLFRDCHRVNDVRVNGEVLLNIFSNRLPNGLAAVDPLEVLE